mmetsp:Transcript_37616/g.57636  ORF Transcript_37616/g.57636 Transcript_37616/m.57636 type:complete len:95 (+) Transcript_37616:1-285(+)
MISTIKASFGHLLATFCLLNNLTQEQAYVAADQPVHCKLLILLIPAEGLRGQVYGVWNFHVSQKSDVVNLFQVDEVCTHKLPNKLQIIDKGHEW